MNTTATSNFKIKQQKLKQKEIQRHLELLNKHAMKSRMEKDEGTLGYMADAKGSYKQQKKEQFQ